MEFHVRIVEATNVPKMDTFGGSDVFCTVKSSAGATEYKTKVIDNTTTPLWNAEFSLPVKDPATDKVMIQMYDQDSVSSNDLIASYEVSVADFEGKGVVEKWYHMNHAEGVPDGCRIRLVFHLAPLGAPRFA